MSDVQAQLAPPSFRGELTTQIRGTGVVSLARSVLRQRPLILELARREMTDVHAGQAGGPIWIVVHPLMMFAVYAFLFTVVFKVRIGGRGPDDYTVYLFAGLAPWLLTQDVLSRATTIMIANSTIVKKVMFPTEALVAKSIMASLKVQGILLLVVIVYTAWVRHSIPASYMLLPVLVAMHLMLIWGLALFLAVITPYFRDVSEFVRVFLLMNVYLIPVMYLPDMVPEAIRFVLVVNPFSHLIWCYQDVFYFNTIAHPLSWGVLAVLACGATISGSYAFIRLRHHLPSVL
jgi:lipopolysaccharide transport system permease protein